jgi:hypothetical protein
MKRPLIAAAALVAVVLAGCVSSESESTRNERGTSAVEHCRTHGGVIAFEDDSVICRDQSSDDERGSSAVEQCRERDGVAAFDDDIVICQDQSFHEVKER